MAEAANSTAAAPLVSRTASKSLMAGAPTHAREALRPVLDELLQGLKESRAGGAVHHPVIAGHGDGHHGGDFNLAVLDDGALLARTHRDDAALRRVDDGGEIHPWAPGGGIRRAHL